MLWFQRVPRRHLWDEQGDVTGNHHFLGEEREDRWQHYQGIHEFSDSQFGHVFASGESRALAIANMVLRLKEIRTNVDYTIDLLHACGWTVELLCGLEQKGPLGSFCGWRGSLQSIC